MTQEGCSTPPAGQIAPPNTPDQPSLHVPTLIRSDDKPGLGVMSGGEKQDSGTWQEKLQEKCREVHINPPIYEIFSDKRGGRTAWSSKVTVSGQCVAARYWYDGKYLYNAKEDAAEVALKFLSTSKRNTSSQAVISSPSRSCFESSLQVQIAET